MVSTIYPPGNKEVALPKLKFISIYVMGGSCNESCSYCYIYSPFNTEVMNLFQKYKNMQNRVEIPFEKFQNIIDDAHKLGVIHLSLTADGDPFLHPKMNDMIGYAYEKGFIIDIATHGAFFKKNMGVMDKVSQLKIHLVSVV